MHIEIDKWQPQGIPWLENNALIAVKENTRNLLVAAGPGAGKTELLAQKACFLLQTGALPYPRRILAISFKKDAAKNLQERVKMRCGEQLALRFESYTFDAFAKSLLDRFSCLLPESWRPSTDYEIAFDLFNWRTLRERIQALLGDSYSIEELESINFNGFCRSYMTKFQLPNTIELTGNLSEDIGFLAWQHWLSKRPSQLAFPMISALAELLLRSNHSLKKALQATYGYIFLDEFQDTTQIQYNLFKTAFLNSDSKLIAVGDEKQRIMVWADAIRDNFTKYENDFTAQKISLKLNFRSSPRLVEIQNRIAKVLEGETAQEVTSAKQNTNGECRALLFPSDVEESRFLVEQIDALLKASYSPRDICILVRQRPGAFLESLASMARNSDIQIRDESQMQDLLAEPAIKLLVSLWKVIFSMSTPDEWDEVIMFLTLGTGVIDEVQGRIQERRVEKFKKQIASAYKAQKFSLEAFSRLVVECMAFLGEEIVKATFSQYEQGNFLSSCLSNLAACISEQSKEDDLIPSSIERFLGKDSIPLMTMHKSKGLEFKTVFFIGFEDENLWNYRNNRNEETCGFFVAFSRAKEQIIFTACRRRGQSHQNIRNIQPLYNILTQSGVELEGMH